MILYIIMYECRADNRLQSRRIVQCFHEKWRAEEYLIALILDTEQGNRITHTYTIEEHELV